MQTCIPKKHPTPAHVYGTGVGVYREINSIRFTGPKNSISYPSGTVKRDERTTEKMTKIQKIGKETDPLPCFW